MFVATWGVWSTCVCAYISQNEHKLHTPTYTFPNMNCLRYVSPNEDELCKYKVSPYQCCGANLGDTKPSAPNPQPSTPNRRAFSGPGIETLRICQLRRQHQPLPQGQGLHLVSLVPRAGLFSTLNLRTPWAGLLPPRTAPRSAIRPKHVSL